jgi:4'-phosphopantetheinyl transferase
MLDTPKNRVTIWTASTALALEQVGEENLGEKENAQAQLLKKEGDRVRFLAARSVLRHALTEAVSGEIPIEAWDYVEGTNGKPLMAPHLPPLEFNISHAADCVAVAVSTSGPVGVDVESTLPDERLEIVGDILGVGEREHLSHLPENRQRETFLKFWTLKEACAKALGLGAMLDFRELEVLFNPLSVVAKKGLLGLDETLDVETSETLIDQVFYRISIARISNSTGDTEFCLRPLA